MSYRFIVPLPSSSPPSSDIFQHNDNRFSSSSSPPSPQDDPYTTEDHFLEQLDELLLGVLKEREELAGTSSALWDSRIVPATGSDGSHSDPDAHIPGDHGVYASTVRSHVDADPQGDSDYDRSVSGFSTSSSMDSDGYFQRFDSLSPAVSANATATGSSAVTTAFATASFDASLTYPDEHTRTSTQHVTEQLRTSARPLKRKLANDNRLALAGPPRGLSPISSSHSTFEPATMSSPANKKFKSDRSYRTANGSITGTHSNTRKHPRTLRGRQTVSYRPNFAQAPASFRRALSLRSVADVDIQGPGKGRRWEHDGSNKENCFRTHTPTVRLNVIPERPIFEHAGSRAYTCVPTVPTTPAARPHTHAHAHDPRALRRAPRQRLLAAVPIIAPPAAHLIPRAPEGEQGRAWVRLGRFLERERRRADGGGVGGGECGPRIRWDDADAGVCVQEARRLWDARLGIGAALRREVVAWILDVLPGDVSRGPCEDEDDDEMGDDDNDEEEEEVNYDDLYDQLATSAETRFHAAYMFLSYFCRVMGTGDGVAVAWKNGMVGIDGGDISEEEPARQVDNTVAMELLQAGRRLVTWDIAVGCVAVSVKLHRDVLPPLNPVYASDFLSLAPHYMTYDDLEAAQRDILSTLAYALGDTPQPILDELWRALPSLRRLLASRGGWSGVRRATWGRLFAAMLAPDVLRFRISVLTGAALVDALGGAQGRCERAAEEERGVVADVQRALAISDDELRDCRMWFRLGDAAAG